MVEFAVAAFLLVFLMLGGIELMRAYLTAEVLGEAARIAARESATHPGSLGTPLDDDVFIESYTVIDLDNLLLPDGSPLLTDEDGDLDVDEDDLFRVIPPLHESLRSVMIRDDLSLPGRRLLRFPGSLFQDPGETLGRDLVVKVPRIVAEGATVDVELFKVIELSFDSATNRVGTQARYHFQFASLPSRSFTTGQYQMKIDPGMIVITNPAELGSYTTPINYDLKPPGNLNFGKMRTLDVSLEMDAVARKEIP